MDTIFLTQNTEKKIVGLAVYDFQSARLAAHAGVDFLLVGDSLGMNVFGYSSTQLVTLDDMIRHTGAVMRGAPDQTVVIDLPYGSYDTAELALETARRVHRELGLSFLKIEGRPDIVKNLVEHDFQVLGHIGLKPQTAERFILTGRGDEAHLVIDEALAVESAGACGVIVECVPQSLGMRITELLKIPTIGIGAGAHTSGQILVLQDIIGMSPLKKPKFVKQYCDIKPHITDAIKHFKNDVEHGIFPGPEEVYFSD